MPFGGMFWQVLHYLVGFRRLGFDVWYVEDSDRFIPDIDTWLHTTDYEKSTKVLAEVLEICGLANHWIVRETGSKKCYGGKDFEGLMGLYKNAVAVFNLCGAQEYLSYHDAIKKLVYIETDPVMPQIAIAKGNEKTINIYKRYHHIFTYAENIGAEDCLLPVEKFSWRKTRPPVVMDWWNMECAAPKMKKMTTVANWDTKDKGVEWQGKTYYWQKDFTRFIDLPRFSKIPIELTLGSIKQEALELIQSKGWHYYSSKNVSDLYKYHDYICNSMGEFTVSKDQYVRFNTGWFSDRSVCYLAAGRPVITEETGFSKFIPTGEGLFAFKNEEEILNAMDSIEKDYEGNSQRAKEIAEEYFKAETVLAEIVSAIGI